MARLKAIQGRSDSARKYHDRLKQVPGQDFNLQNLQQIHGFWLPLHTRIMSWKYSDDRCRESGEPITWITTWHGPVPIHNGGSCPARSGSGWHG